MTVSRFGRIWKLAGGSQRPARQSGGQSEGLGGQHEGMKASKGVCEVSPWTEGQLEGPGGKPEGLEAIKRALEDSQRQKLLHK